MFKKKKKKWGFKGDSEEVPENSKPAGAEAPDAQKTKSATKSAPQQDLAASAQATKPTQGPAQPVTGSRTEATGAVATAGQAARSAQPSQGTLKAENRSIPVKAAESKSKPQTTPVGNNVGKKRGKRRPKNTAVVSLQMPAALIKVLDEIVEAGAYRSRSDVILQAVRAHSEVSRRLARLEAKQPSQKK